MNEKILSWAALLFATVTMVAMIVAVSTVVALVGVSKQSVASEPLGATGTRFPNGLAVGTASVTTAGGLFVRSAATTTFSTLSTSATQGFCQPFNATSTNTLLNLTYGASSSASTVGIVPIIKYGACQ